MDINEQNLTESERTAFNWFKETQENSVIDKSTGQFSDWFHGLISRKYVNVSFYLIYIYPSGRHVSLYDAARNIFCIVDYPMFVYSLVMLSFVAFLTSTTMIFFIASTNTSNIFRRICYIM